MEIVVELVVGVVVVGVIVVGVVAGNDPEAEKDVDDGLDVVPFSKLKYCL